MVAVDMLGMSNSDVEAIVRAMTTDLGDIITVPDRSHQGILNHLLVVKLLQGTFANDSNVIYNGRSVIDAERAEYAGVSQGGILGAVILAVSQDIDRGWLGVPGTLQVGAEPLGTVLTVALTRPSCHVRPRATGAQAAYVDPCSARATGASERHRRRLTSSTVAGGEGSGGSAGDGVA